MSIGCDQSQLTKQIQVFTQRRPGEYRIKAAGNVFGLPFLTVAKNLQNRPLPLGQIVADSQRWHIAARQKTYDGIPSPLLEFRIRVTCQTAHLDDLQRPSSPTFNQATTEKQLGQMRIARPRFVLAFQIVHGQAER